MVSPHTAEGQPYDTSNRKDNTVNTAKMRCCLTKDGNACAKPGADWIVEVTQGRFGAMCTYHTNRHEAGIEVRYNSGLLSSTPDTVPTTKKEVNTMNTIDRLDPEMDIVVMTEKAMNGYRLGLVDYVLDIMGIAGTAYRMVAVDGDSVSTLPVSMEKCAFAVSRDVQDILLYVDGHEEFGKLFTDAGFEFKYESKFEKRANIFTRPAPLFGHRKGGYRLLEIDQDTMLKANQACELEDLDLLSESGRILDGMIIGRKSLLTEAVNETKDQHLGHLPKSQAARVARRFTHPVSNFRMINPQGFWKGQVFWMKDKTFDRLYGDYDFVQMAGETKDAIRHVTDGFFVADPQRGHDKTSFNIQSMCNRRFDAAEPNWMRDEVKAWADERFEQGLDPETGPEYLFGDVDAFIDLLIETAQSGKDPSQIARYQARGTELMLRGIHPRAIPDIMNSALNFERAIWRPNGKPKIPAGEAGAHVQIISDAAARFAGWDGDVAQGQIKYWRKYNVAIVSSVDYVTRFFQNSGGSDHDDFFDLIEFTSDKGEDVREIIVWRNPSTMREYSMFTIIGDWPITKAAPIHITPKVKPLTEAEADGEKIFAEARSFFKILQTVCSPEAMESVNAAAFLKQLMLQGDGVTYKGLPDGKPIHHGASKYTFNDFIVKMEDRTQGAGSVDKAVANSMLYETTLGPLTGYRLCAMEDKVDAYVQGGAAEARVAIDEESDKLFFEVMRAAKGDDAYIDRNLADFRNLGGIYYMTTGQPMPRKATKAYSGKLNDSIDVNQNTWFGHFERSTRTYLAEKTNMAKQIVSDTCVSFAPDCIAREGLRYYGFDGWQLYSADGNVYNLANKKSEKPFPVDLNFGAAGLLRRWKLYFNERKQQMLREQAQWMRETGKNSIPRDMNEAMLNMVFEDARNMAGEMFFDPANWDPSQCIPESAFESNRRRNAFAVNKAIRDEASNGLYTQVDFDQVEDLYRFVLSLAAACYKIPTSGGLRSFFMFQNDVLWDLLMKAISYFDEDEYIDPEDLWKFSS